ncbi:hypothetical protein CAEBREN_11346 [Caenorhabditis brenneri]|uniref:CCHC-type domain-containing protein n=1 Tax=Caenorhabditis brenneri TaxID=135651 RepID=G0NX93_CAEBE|nr:hypothetical protein CAEBREN_11346 [Caenorhabditis brenneri]
MANANLTPMPFVRKFGSASTTTSSDRNSSPTSKDGRSSQKQSLASLAQTAFPSRYDPNAFVDISGAAISAPTVTGACKRCGYPGHLYFQCRNHIEVRPNMSTKAYDVSSTSSESSDDETPLALDRKKEKKLRKKERKERKKAKKLEKKEKRRKERKEKKKRRQEDSDEASDSDDERKEKARKEKKRRRHNDSDDESDDSDDSRKKKAKKSKKERRKRNHSSSSSEDSHNDSKRRRRSDY